MAMPLVLQVTAPDPRPATPRAAQRSRPGSEWIGGYRPIDPSGSARAARDPDRRGSEDCDRQILMDLSEL